MINTYVHKRRFYTHTTQANKLLIMNRRACVLPHQSRSRGFIHYSNIQGQCRYNTKGDVLQPQYGVLQTVKKHETILSVIAHPSQKDTALPLLTTQPIFAPRNHFLNHANYFNVRAPTASASEKAGMWISQQEGIRSSLKVLLQTVVLLCSSGALSSQCQMQNAVPAAWGAPQCVVWCR